MVSLRRLAALVLTAFACQVAGAQATGQPPPRKDTGSLWQEMSRQPQLAATAAFDARGRLWLAHVKEGHVLLRFSDDVGKTYSPDVAVNAAPEAIAANGENRPKLAFGPGGSVLVSWTRPGSKPFTGDIRFARSNDGLAFDAPVTVHQNRQEITHRFESMTADASGHVQIVWIDKRDGEAARAAGQAYRGAAIYGVVSRDGGRRFQPEQRIADHSCECCRIALGRDKDGAPLVMWRHVFAPNERDHAITRLRPDGTPEGVQRATFDRWQVDACPHHGPSLAVDAKGVRHAVWFNQKDGEGRVFYGRLAGSSVAGQRAVGGPLAAHADIVANGSRLLIAWKEFDGDKTRLHVMMSGDGGARFASRELAATAGASDQPRLLVRGSATYVFWRTEKEGFGLYPVP